MHDIRAIRDDPASFDHALRRRGLAPQADALLAIDSEWRSATTRKQSAETARNQASKAIGLAKAQKDEARADGLMRAVEEAKEIIARAGEEEARLHAQLHAILSAIPNLAQNDVPEGADEHANVEVHRAGTPRTFDFPVLDHVALGEKLGLMDFEAAARMSGARFVVLKGALARLERALGAFMLDIQTREHGFVEISPPLLVRDEAAYGTDKLPKFADDLFQTTNHFWLISTAEMPLTAMVMGQMLPKETLPMRYTALTPCFRSEAGSAGRDIRGMIRQHQFYKVELVSITTPEQSQAEHERMRICAQTILERLQLPYRTMLLCAGDMGFGAQKTYDLEVWLPSQNQYREISSVSNCGEFQARRMNARYRDEERKLHFIHSLNGSGLAVGRTLVALLENYQQADGSITIPDALVPFMDGLRRIA